MRDRMCPRLAMAEEAARRALALAPELPEAHLALGAYYERGPRDYERAAAEYAVAGETLGDDPGLLQQVAFMQRRMGDWARGSS